MPEPVSIGVLYFLLHSAASLSLRVLAEDKTNGISGNLLEGVAGNFFYDVLKKGAHAATRQLVRLTRAEDEAKRPTNWHLQKALRKAQLKATLMARQSRW